MKRLGRGVAKPELWLREVDKGLAWRKVYLGLSIKSGPSTIGRTGEALTAMRINGEMLRIKVQPQ
jgi:hypothetical protein